MSEYFQEVYKWSEKAVENGFFDSLFLFAEPLNKEVIAITLTIYHQKVGGYCWGPESARDVITKISKLAAKFHDNYSPNYRYQFKGTWYVGEEMS